jgi:hypothetical protein
VAEKIMNYLDVGHNSSQEDWNGECWCLGNGEILTLKNTRHAIWEEGNEGEAVGRIDRDKELVSFVAIGLSYHRAEYVKKQLWKKFGFKVVDFTNEHGYYKECNE